MVVKKTKAARGVRAKTREQGVSTEAFKELLKILAEGQKQQQGMAEVTERHGAALAALTSHVAMLVSLAGTTTDILKAHSEAITHLARQVDAKADASVASQAPKHKNWLDVLAPAADALAATMKRPGK